LSFAEQLIRIRKKRRFSQQQLAMRSGISQQAVSNLETGKSSPSEYTIRQLAAALRVSMSELLEDDKKSPTADSSGELEDIIDRVRHLQPQALARLSDYLEGLEDGQGTASPSPVVPDSSGEAAE
jgi:transcriptional regulator with XRE-family HTH domain